MIIYSAVAKVLTRCFCLKQNYPDNRRYGRDRRWPNYLQVGEVFSNPLDTNYANWQQFPIKWSFGRSYQTLGTTIEMIFIVVPKVWQFLPKLHLIGNCCQLAQLVSRGFEKTSPTYKKLGHLLSRPYLQLSAQFCFKQRQRVKTFATALYVIPQTDLGLSFFPCFRYLHYFSKYYISKDYFFK